MIPIEKKITFLYTNIGRGHPFYLDGIIEAMVQTGSIALMKNKTDVFECSTGLSKTAWKTVRYLYRNGSQDGIISRIYSSIRKSNDYNTPGLLQKILTKSIVEQFISEENPLIAAHPILIAALKGRKNLYYQHGELITPEEAVVRGASTVFVPTEHAAEPFYQAGYKKEQVIITGLCIEPGLVKQAEDCFKARINRIDSNSSLTGAFFTSGAEPVKHLEKILKAVKSVAASQGKAVIFGKNKGKLNNIISNEYSNSNFDYKEISGSDDIPHTIPDILMVKYKTRREENSLVNILFRKFDYFCAPSHERSNWAVGLGLPMFMLDPPIGPFSPLNREFLLNSGCAEALENDNDADELGEKLPRYLIDGTLLRMARSGFGKFPINGFNKLVEFFS